MKLLLRSMSVLGFLAPIVAYTLWPHPEIIHDDNLIDKGWAVGYLCLSFVGWKAIQDKTIKTVFCIGFWLSVNNFIDEFFFNPEETGWNEYLFAVLIITVTACQKLRKKRT